MLVVDILQGLEAGQAEGREELQAALAQRAEAEGAAGWPGGEAAGAGGGERVAGELEGAPVAFAVQTLTVLWKTSFSGWFTSVNMHLP